VAAIAALLTCAALQPAPRHSNTWAIVSLASGAALVAGSFAVADAADRRYADYLRATDPDRIQDLYNEAVLFDRVSAGSILTGEVLIATGIYLAFLRHPAPSRLSFALEPSKCGVSLRF